MKLLIENWIKFINEMQEDPKYVSFSDEFKDGIEELFDENPDIQKEIKKLTKKYLQDSVSLSEEKSDDHPYGAEETYVSSDLEMILKAISGVSLGTGLLIGEFGSKDPQIIAGALGAAGIAGFLAFIAKKARENLESKGKEPSGIFKGKERKTRKYDTVN